MGVNCSGGTASVVSALAICHSFTMQLRRDAVYSAYKHNTAMRLLQARRVLYTNIVKVLQYTSHWTKVSTSSPLL
jgi:hypothetical protein